MRIRLRVPFEIVWLWLAFALVPLLAPLGDVYYWRIAWRALGGS